jgi:hypothetical protein
MFDKKTVHINYYLYTAACRVRQEPAVSVTSVPSETLPSPSPSAAENPE